MLLRFNPDSLRFLQDFACIHNMDPEIFTYARSFAAEVLRRNEVLGLGDFETAAADLLVHIGGYSLNSSKSEMLHSITFCNTVGLARHHAGENGGGVGLRGFGCEVDDHHEMLANAFTVDFVCAHVLHQDWCCIPPTNRFAKHLSCKGPPYLLLRTSIVGDQVQNQEVPPMGPWALGPSLWAQISKQVFENLNNCIWEMKNYLKCYWFL